MNIIKIKPGDFALHSAGPVARVAEVRSVKLGEKPVIGLKPRDAAATRPTLDRIHPDEIVYVGTEAEAEAALSRYQAVLAERAPDIARANLRIIRAEESAQAVQNAAIDAARTAARTAGPELPVAAPVAEDGA